MMKTATIERINPNPNLMNPQNVSMGQMMPSLSVSKLAIGDGSLAEALYAAPTPASPVMATKIVLRLEIMANHLATMNHYKPKYARLQTRVRSSPGFRKSGPVNLSCRSSALLA